jgi:hypothetical protein
MITKNIHRFFKTILIGCSLLVVGLWGCNDDEVNGFLSFSEDNLLLKAAGDEVVIDVTAGSDWSAESMADWCMAEKNNEGKLVVRVTPSDDVYERGTAVKVNCGDNVVRLSVRQEPMAFEVLEGKKTLNFEKGIATDVLKIRTNLNWKVEIADTTGWLQAVDTVGTGDVDLTFKTTDNSPNGERSTTVRLRYGVRSMKLIATQKGGIRLEGHISKHYGNRDLSNGYNLIFLGEGFTDKDLIEGTGAFDLAVDESLSALWEVEPYKTYKEYFNVYSIAIPSKERGVSKEGGEAKNTAFGVTYKEVNGLPQLDMSSSLSKAWQYASTIMGMTEEILNNQTTIVVLVNDEVYAGQTYFWENNYRSLSVVPLNRDTQLPGGFTNIFLHEVGGHGIGKLADEWSVSGNELTSSVKTDIQMKANSKLYYSNLAFPSVAALLPYPQYYWSLIGNAEAYKGVLGGYDGGCGYTSGSLMIVHSEDKSCMLSHQPYFSVGCRWSIVRYLMFRLGEYEYSSAGQTALYQHFLEHDSFVVPDAPVLSERPQLPQPIFVE